MSTELDPLVVNENCECPESPDVTPSPCPVPVPSTVDPLYIEKECGVCPEELVPAQPSIDPIEEVVLCPKVDPAYDATGWYYVKHVDSGIVALVFNVLPSCAPITPLKKPCVTQCEDDPYYSIEMQNVRGFDGYKQWLAPNAEQPLKFYVAKEFLADRYFNKTNGFVVAGLQNDKNQWYPGVPGDIGFFKTDGHYWNNSGIHVNGSDPTLSLNGNTIGTVPMIFEEVIIPVTITVDPIATQTVVSGNPYVEQITASGGTLPYTYTATGLPAAVVVDLNTGAISGTVTDPAGTYPVVITVTDADLNTGNYSYDLVVT